MIDVQDPKAGGERAILVGYIKKMQEDASEEFLDELEFLAETAGAVAVERFTQKLDYPDPKTYLGKGKIEELKSFIVANNIDVAIFDDELSPSQIRNIEKLFDIKVIDRTNLILDIFAARAQTSYARTQVELAQCQYLLPRLTGLWTHLERQKGGIGMRGPGETQIETDRRIIEQKISLLKDKLKKIDQQMSTQRGNRGQVVRIALVGYTNVGKSTLMNLLCKTDVLAENKLFATLDTTVRKISIDNLPILLTDTVGFIRKLPTQLVESFKSTLDEVREADVLIHVVDISHESFEHHIESVNKVLGEINSMDKPVIMVFNKIDAYTYVPMEEFDIDKTNRNFSLEDWQQTWMNKMSGNSVFISATEKENIAELRHIIYRVGAKIHEERFPFNNFLY